MLPDRPNGTWSTWPPSCGGHAEKFFSRSLREHRACRNQDPSVGVAFIERPRDMFDRTTLWQRQLCSIEKWNHPWYPFRDVVCFGNAHVALTFPWHVTRNLDTRAIAARQHRAGKFISPRPPRPPWSARFCVRFEFSENYATPSQLIN